MFFDQTIGIPVESPALSGRSLGAHDSITFQFHPSVLPYRLIAVTRSALCPEWKLTTDRNMEM